MKPFNALCVDDNANLASGTDKTHRPTKLLPLSHNSSCLFHQYHQYHQYKAEQHAITNFINCYLREFAIPNQDISIDEPTDDLPLCILHSKSSSNDRLLTIHFPPVNGTISSTRIIVPVTYISRLGKCSLSGAPWLKVDNQPWRCLCIHQLVGYIHEYIGNRYQLTINQELKDQIDNSINVTTAFLQASVSQHTIHNKQNHSSVKQYNDFINSEQALLWGHAYHPSPKSRQGVEMKSLISHSPETQSRFALFWFKIHASLVTFMGDHTQTMLQDIAHTLLCESDESINLSDASGWVYYPCHPWESEGILANADIQQAIASGYLLPLGIKGKAVSPTSSVRTLYHDQLAYFIKCSIHVRLTNCVRKNAWYELHSAVYLNKILKKIYHSKRLTNPTFKLMLEPGASSVDITAKFPNANSESSRFIQEAFGLLFRESFSCDEIAHLTPQVAAALFTEDKVGQSMIAQRLRQQLRIHAHQSHSEVAPYETLATLWFERYANILINGAFDYFFNHGIVFEPHLQNTVIGLSQGLPTCIWVRDLEGTKLVDTMWSLGDVPDLSESSKQSILYTREKGWSRIAYCVLINNLSEAIFYLSQTSKDSETLEFRLWKIVREILVNWQLVNGAQAEIQSLLDGGSIPSKTNLKTRLLQLADKHASYIMIACPWHTQDFTTNKDSHCQTNSPVATKNY